MAWPPIYRNVFVAACVLASVLLSLHYFFSPPDHFGPPSRSLPYFGKSWKYDVQSHRNDHGLSDAQCSSAFPELYAEIKRSVKYWGKNGKVTPESVDIEFRRDAAVRAMIYNKELYIIEAKGLGNPGYRSRSLSTLHQINRAILTSPNPIPNIEFSFVVDDMALPPPDKPKITTWTFSRLVGDAPYDRLWLMPDFAYWSWAANVGSFADFQRKVSKTDKKIVEKDQRVVWRGAIGANPGIRGALLEATENQTWADVKSIDWANQTDLALNKKTMAEHCDYAFTAHTEGRSYSGRLKYLLNCRSVTFVHDLHWVTHFYHLIEHHGPNQNAEVVRSSWDDLGWKVKDFSTHPEKAQRIADNAVDTFRDRYLTPAAETCYWRKLFHGWASVAFEPDPYEVVKADDGSAEQKWRGVSFEQYMFLDPDFPPPKG